MHRLKNIFRLIGYCGVSNTHPRQYRLIRYITFEIVIVSVIVVCLYIFLKLWYLVAVIGTGGILTLMNLWFLVRTKNTKVCGHIIILVTFLTVLLANYLVRGISTSYSLWFYVIPLLAASLTGWRGLLIYSPLSLLLIVGAGSFSIPPFYHLPSYQLYKIEWTNHLFAYVIIVTTLGSLMRENERYEQLLDKKNYVLQFEKDKYKYLARFDQLTGLPNRQYFKQHLQKVIDSLADNYCATVFFMDLDNFKFVNDRYGHDKGDHLLLQTASRLQLCFRKGDFVARLGGDEFTAIVLHSQNKNIIDVIVKKIINEFNKPFMLENIEYYCSISIGLSTFPYDSKIISELMNKADLAMYVAKKKKKSTDLS